MCVLYGSFVSKVIPRTFAMGNAVLFILRSRLFLYSTGFGVNRMQVVFSIFSVRLLCRSGCMYFLAALVFVCVDVMVM